mgnify:CR=1 FL=1
MPTLSTTRYRDLTVLVGFGVQLFMYLSPVVYPLSSLSETYRSLMILNPVAPVLETFRYAMLGAGGVSLGELAVSTAEIVVILWVGMVLFNHVERTFMDTV